MPKVNRREATEPTEDKVKRVASDIGTDRKGAPNRRDLMRASAAALLGAATLPNSAQAQGQPALARIVTVQGENFEDALRNFTERGVPRLKSFAGITAVYVISDPENRLYKIISFWESAEAAEHAYQSMAAMRQAVQDTGMSFELLDYEVEIADVL